MEIRDLYNKNRKKLNMLNVRGTEIPKDTYILVVHAIIINSNNQILIQQRQSFARKSPNKWDLTVGGCSIYGETSNMAINRELQEELGIDIDFSNVRPNFTINYNDGFDDFYIVKKDIDINTVKMQKEEVQNVKWATVKEIKSMIEEKTFVPYKKGLIDFIFENSKSYGSLDM